MVLTNISHAYNYFQLHPFFEKVFDIICKTNLTKLIEGKNEIDGDKLFAILTKPGTSENELVKLESHKKYIDIHYIVEGQELFGFTSINRCNSQIGEFNSIDDYVLYNDEFESFLLSKGDLVIVFPHDPHAPCIETRELTKIVFKVKL